MSDASASGDSGSPNTEPIEEVSLGFAKISIEYSINLAGFKVAAYDPKNNKFVFGSSDQCSRPQLP